MPVKGVRAGLGNGLVRTQNQVQRAVEYECIFFDNVRQRGVCGQPERRVRTKVADMVAAVRRGAGLCAVVTRRPQPNAYPRRSRFRPDTPEQHHRREHAADVFIAGCDIGNSYGAAVLVIQRRLEDCGICLVSLLAVRKVDQFDLEETRQVGFAVVSQQAAKDRVGIELRHARPDHRGPFIDERCYLAVADQADVETGQEILSLVSVNGKCGPRWTRASDAHLRRPAEHIRQRCRGCHRHES